MVTGEAFFIRTASYRVVIDPAGTARIRIVRRVKFRTFLQVFTRAYLELRKIPGVHPHVIIYVSPSLSDELSGNLKDFLDFAVSCLEGTFELRIVG